MKARTESMKKQGRCFFGIIMIMVMLLSLVSCSESASDKDASPEKTRRFIIETDSGADDAAAIILAA